MQMGNHSRGLPKPSNTAMISVLTNRPITTAFQQRQYPLHSACNMAYGGSTSTTIYENPGHYLSESISSLSSQKLMA